MLPASTLTFALFAWFLATLGHVLLTAHLMGQLRGPHGTRDDAWFDSALTAVGSLAVVVHVVAATVGLTLWSGLVGLAVWHAVLMTWVRRSGGRTTATEGETASGPRYERVLETAAIATLLAITIAWVDWSSVSLAVVGTDAANYHVPVAVNLALGASPMDLPPTQHLYPMTTSSLAAWFLVASGDALLLDVTMVLPFMLLAASTALLFRLATGASGLAWSTWFVVALSATPMLRASSYLSADLLFAAAFVATLAQGVRIWTNTRNEWVDILLAGLALGLLVGSKTTGVAAAALLGAAWLIVLAVTRRARWRATLGAPTAWAGAAALAIFAGGIWLVRSWLLFGSPVAPNGLTVLGVELLAGPAFEPTTYLSVLGDVQNTSAYSLASRTSHFVNQWFGPAYLPFLLVALSIPVDAWFAWRRGAAMEKPTTRLVIAFLALGTGVPLVWLLIGAPWTSLEWTQGHALRYALPVAVMLPVLSLVALFPVSWRWHRHSGVGLAVGTLAAAGSLWLLTGAQTPEAFGPPHVNPVSATLGTIMAVALQPAVRARLLAGVGRRVLVTAVIAAAAAFILAGRDAGARTAADLAAPAGTEGAQLRAAVLDAESGDGRPCGRRRFMVITRFDEPLAVQSTGFDAVMFYAARDVSSAERVGPLSSCDYVIATRAVLGTERGEALLSVFYPSGRTSEIGDAGRFVLLTRR